MLDNIARLSACTEREIAALAPLPHAYATIYDSVAWPYWFGLHADKPLAAQLRRLRDKHPRRRCGRGICAAIRAAPALPAELWRRVHAFAGDDVLRTVKLAMAIARQRHEGWRLAARAPAARGAAGRRPRRG